MRCPREACGGTVWDFEDYLGSRCLSCGRGLEPRPTLEELEGMGIQGWENRKESDGHGRLSALEAEGFHSGPRGKATNEMGRRVRP